MIFIQGFVKAKMKKKVTYKPSVQSEQLVSRLKWLAFEKDHVNKPLEIWRTVKFSDEGKFCIFGIKGHKLVWKKPCTALQKEYLVPKVKHGGSGFRGGAWRAMMLASWRTYNQL
ncbi:transposable element Tc1 transposase [Trichonephila clavipes]|nr:transposable element Tc1 transposase [Trichonephila clavipes]